LTERLAPAPRPLFSRGDTEFDRLFFSHGWERTRLGPIESWPKTLRGYVDLILRLPTPAIIFWGPDHLQLYNAGYAVIMGPRHPKYLGATYAECWPDTYPTIHPWMQRVLQGEVLEVVNAPFTLTRHGFPEETYFTFAFTPLRDDEGKIGGFLQPVIETTAEVLGQRRAAVLRGLTPDKVTAEDVSAALATDPHDVPFSHLYLWSESAQRLVLTASSGPVEAPLDAPAQATEAFSTGSLQGPSPAAEIVPSHADPAARAVAVSVRRSANEPARGAMVFGVSPRLPFDDAYRSFFESVAREISGNLAAGHERRARLDAERERQNLRDFFRQTPVPLCILLGRELRYALANRPYLDLVGRDVMGLTVREAFSDEEAAEYVRILDQVFETGEPFVGKEMSLSLEGGPLRIVNVSYTPLRDGDGDVKGILGFVYDVTAEAQARKRSESLAADLQLAVKARDEFLGIASHELKTPLTALRMELQGAQRRGSPPDSTRLLRATDRLTRLIDDMLDIARTDAGKLSLTKHETELSPLVNDVIERFEPQWAAAQMQVERSLEPGLFGVWDSYRLEQVLTNLFTNAMKYAAGKPVKVTTARRDGLAVLTVSDRGPGIAPHDRERIFGRFERAVSERSVGGLGLGLYIAQQIVLAHGGTIRVENHEGGGASFVVELPLR
jgi:PAS domain S-box-containing protein